jgi:two-component system, cell cycle sensor histidine kinase and response regulator CckA
MTNIADAGGSVRVQNSPEQVDARYQAVLDSALDCIIWTDARGTIIEFNAAAERTLRISRASALGKDLSETILPAALRPHLRSELFASVASSGLEIVGTRLETKVMRAGADEFPAEITVNSAVINESTTFIVYIRDLTARRLAEETMVRLAAIVEGSQDAIIGTDLKYCITSWNKGAEQMYGYTAAEVLGKSISIIAPPDRVEETITIRDELRTGIKTKSFETVRVAKNGRRLDVSIRISPVLNSDGNIVGASAIGRDITAFKQTQDALRKASETSIYASPIPIIAVDTQRRVTLWNPAAEAEFGWSEEEVLGKPNPVKLEGGNKQASALHKRALAGETLTGVELHGRKRDGTMMALSLSATTLWDENRRIKGVIGFLTDITETKRAEEVLRRTEQKYRTIFENAIEGIYQATPQGKYISANPALARMFGFESPEELMEARIDVRNQQYVNREMHEEFVSLMRRQGTVQNFEYQAYRKDGKVIWVSESARVARDGHGRLLHFEGVVQDITEQRELEQQLRQMQKIEAVGQLAGGVAHDFNNLLMAISSYTELLQLKITQNDSARRYLDEIDKAIDRAASLTKGLLTFSRKQVLSPQILDLNALVAEQVKMLRRLVPENIDIKFSPGSNQASVKADPTQIEQLVMNLVINARDAMPDGGRVLIEIGDCGPDASIVPSRHSPSSHVLVAVTDNGCGMDEATKAQIFEPFFTTKESGKGTGLGLAIVLDIVKQSGGKIFVQSEVGRGTTFQISFPRAESVNRQNIEEEIETLAPATETVLLVEDEPTVRESIAEYLRQNGYQTLSASGGPQALSIVRRIETPIHLMLTDVIMPQMSGRELAEKVASIHPEIKIVFMSGYSDNLLSSRQVLDPKHVLLQKPIRLASLGKRLREILGRNTVATAASAGK